MALVACGALVVAGPAFAAGELDVVAQSSITISGFTDSPDSFVGSVTLHATGGEVQFTFLPSDLAGPGSESLDRSHVSLVGATTVASGAFVIDTVKVAGLSDPGTYTGKVTLENGDQSLVVRADLTRDTPIRCRVSTRRPLSSSGSTAAMERPCARLQSRARKTMTGRTLAGLRDDLARQLRAMRTALQPDDDWPGVLFVKYDGQLQIGGPS